MIYFLRRANGAIKIGTTTNYQTRLSQLQSLYGNLELLGIMDGGRNEEQALHQRFSRYRLRSTEWFLPSTELTTYIETQSHLNIPKSESRTIKLDSQVHSWLVFLAETYGTTMTNVLKTLAIYAHPNIKNKVAEVEQMQQEIEHIKSPLKPPISVEWDEKSR